MNRVAKTNLSVLVVEDDVEIANLLSAYLEKAGYKPIQARTGSQALHYFKEKNPVCVILDRMLPEMDGLEICRTIRAQSDVPILFVTARVSEEERLEGLLNGADDYIVKPFSFRELVARVEVVLRRSLIHPTISKNGMSHGHLFLDLEKCQVYWKGVEVAFTTSEYKLIQMLLSNPNRVFSRDELLSELYPYASSEVIDRAIDVHIGNIRKKFKELEESAGECIMTVRGFGYRLL